ncbi:M56 family metallopeptidase [Rhodocaloribacter litoris]|uniref:M56 family metallopeptidase n=1 Tax=Rhodocaloribacter litoris TaxID=2558931 RepID=UPI00142435FD|nr:M56 family metallopeptidase [Rhodocaloribacter litoris]QXD14967.1 M56 family metallopeptidase [Rhodocaloribacter litoris]GIV58930.1 MAG: cell envelope biogenesis protein TonB [Rhodothermaceae bacterium]
METLLELLYRLGSGALSHFWIPVLVWTLVALPVYLVLRWRGSLWPEGGYHVLRALLFALPLGVMLGATTGQVLVRLPGFVSVDPLRPDGAGAVLPGVVATAGEGAGWGLLPLVGLFTLGTAVVTLWQLGRLLCRFRALRSVRRCLAPVAPERVPECDVLARRLRLRRKVHLATLPGDVVPMTFGVRKPVVVLPEALLADPSRRYLALAHELVHVRRHDFLFHGIEGSIAAVFAFHPLVDRLCRAIGGYRELVCDREVLALTGCGRRRYATLLFSFLVSTRHVRTVAVGMAESSHLTQRIQAMKNNRKLVSRFSKRTALVLGLVVLAGGTFIVACTDFVGSDVDEPAAEAALQKTGQETFIVVERMPELIGGLASIQSKIRYPEIARKAGVEGRVIVQFTVDEEGRVVDPEVVRGIGAGCDEEAIRAVMEARFVPGMQGGKVVPVRMTIPISFRLPRD